jgi:hypothetical protein
MINQIDRWPLEQFLDAVGLGKIYGPYASRGGHRPHFRYVLTKSADVRRVVKKLRPLLSPRRQREADRLLQRIQDKGGALAERTHCKNGHRFDEINTFVRPDGARGCRLCSRAATKRYRYSRRVDDHLLSA